MRKSIVTLLKSTRAREGKSMMEWPPKDSSVAVRPMTNDEAERIDKVLKESRELGKRILARRKGKPLPQSWRIIRQDREERYKEV